MDGETVWLTQAQMVELFQSSKANISEHINNIFKEGELVEDSVVRIFRTTAADGKNYDTKHYNLDVIISTGYRVKSLRGTQFRRWALQVLREYLEKGFALNDDLLKKGSGGNYWLELLKRIRDIRSSEKVLYRQVLELYATSMDYEANAPESQEFFKTVQNKLHFAAHGHTAAEVIATRANADLPFMGLTTFPGERPAKCDVSIAKNYLTEDELETLNRMVSAFFELAELQALQHRPMYMKDWIKEIDDFTGRYGKGILQNSGAVSNSAALEKANKEYEKYRYRTLIEPSPVERDYLESMKKVQKKIETLSRADEVLDEEELI